MTEVDPNTIHRVSHEIKRRRLQVLRVEDLTPRMRRITVRLWDDAEVDGVGCVPDQDLGFFLGGPPVHRLILPEAGEPGGLGPGGLVELAVDLDRRLQPGNLCCRRPLPLDSDARERILYQQQECEHNDWIDEVARGNRPKNSAPGKYGQSAR